MIIQKVELNYQKMKIIKIAELADDLEEVYDGLKKAMDNLNESSIAKVKIEIKKAIKGLEKIRPHLKYKDRPLRRKL